MHLVSICNPCLSCSMCMWYLQQSQVHKPKGYLFRFVDDLELRLEGGQEIILALLWTPAQQFAGEDALRSGAIRRSVLVQKKEHCRKEMSYLEANPNSASWASKPPNLAASSTETLFTSAVFRAPRAKPALATASDTSRQLCSPVSEK